MCNVFDHILALKMAKQLQFAIHKAHRCEYQREYLHLIVNTMISNAEIILTLLADDCEHHSEYAHNRAYQHAGSVKEALEEYASTGYQKSLNDGNEKPIDVCVVAIDGVVCELSDPEDRLEEVEREYA